MDDKDRYIALQAAARLILDHKGDLEAECCVNGEAEYYHSAYGCPESIECGCPGHEYVGARRSRAADIGLGDAAVDLEVDG